MTAYAGHDPQTPPGAEAMLQTLFSEMEAARRELARRRNAEVAASHKLKAARRRALLSPQCPKAAGTGRTCTVAERDAWVEDQVADEDLAHDLAVTARQAAADHLSTLGKQGSIQQSISRSVIGSYQGQRGEGW
jgi:hypothetical protein